MLMVCSRRLSEAFVECPAPRGGKRDFVHCCFSDAGRCAAAPLGPRPIWKLAGYPIFVALREQFGIAAADTAVLADFSDADFSRPELVAGSLKAGEDFQAMKRERPA
jgi:hypothetical protein